MQQNRKLGSYPTALITISLGVALFLIGFCGWVAITSKELISFVKSNIEVQVYLDKDLSEAQKTSVKNRLRQKAFVVNSDEAIELITKEQAAKIFFRETNEDYQFILSENPFRDAFKLKITEDYFGESYLQEIKRDVEKIPGVHEADYARDFVDGIAQNANKTYIVVSAIVLVFLIATLLLINNTIRLALYSQRFIIHTMQLVGATNAFVQAPFVKRGIIQGIVASVLAVVSLIGLQQIASWQITGFEVIQNFEGILILAFILLVLGPLLAVFSTISSVSRYLRTDLDDLF
jgi:cell division transport system permease protein